jgi:hypothetical protein
MNTSIATPRQHGPAWYAHQLLSQTVDCLAIGPGDVRSRLLKAYDIFNPLTVKHFPEHLGSEFAWVERQLNRHSPYLNPDGTTRKGSVEVSLSRMKNSTGSKIAQTLLHLHRAIDQFLRDHS